MKASITVDLEHDCPPFLDTYQGVTEGVPVLLTSLEKTGVKATFFTTGDVARRFPDTIRQILDRGHELGCHGDTHRRFGTMTPAEAADEIGNAAQTLRQFGRVTSFRAPNLDFPVQYLQILEDHGFQVDSSHGRHKPGTFFAQPERVGKLWRVPASIPPSLVRAPLLKDVVLRLLRNPAVLFFHPWEFVDMTRAPIPWDCRYRTGMKAVETLESAVAFFKNKNAQFSTVATLMAA